MLANCNASDMSAGAMLCEDTLDLDDRKVFVSSDDGKVVSENVRDPSGVLDTVDVPACTVRLIVYEITVNMYKGNAPGG